MLSKTGEVFFQDFSCSHVNTGLGLALCFLTPWLAKYDGLLQIPYMAVEVEVGFTFFLDVVTRNLQTLCKAPGDFLQAMLKGRVKL